MISSSSTDTRRIATPCVAQIDQAAVDEFDRADVDASRGLADQQHARATLDLAGQHDFLLVAAGEFRRFEARRGRADVVGLHPGGAIGDHRAADRAGRQPA
jgi:hypothetical protein